MLYSHRSTVLHAYAACLPDAMNLSARDVVMPVVPMFHVNAWSLPYAGPLVGCKIVFPGAALDGASVHELFETEKVTMSAGVPTVWLGLLQHVQQNNLKFTTLHRTVIGGSACPPAMIRTFEDELRRAGPARLGHDRDVPAGHGVHAEVPASGPGQGRAVRHPVQAGPRDLRRGHEDRGRRGQGAAVGRQGVRRPAGARPLDHFSEYLKGEGGNPLRTDEHGGTGSPPAMWPPSIPTASCRSPTAPRT